jgi:arginine/lysine/histidine transport system ATP-binding protein
MQQNELKGGWPMIEVQHLHKSFKDLEVLTDINYTFKQGKTTVILGASGSGKSTLLRCINRLEEPTAGEILFQGNLISDDNIQEIRKQMGMVFQNFNLFSNMKVIDNVGYALKVVKSMADDEIKAVASRRLASVGLSDKEEAYPKTLSGGQKQRVAIARCLAMEPDVFLFDEPTSSLDPEMVNEVLDVMRDITHQGFTNIIVTHEMGFAKEVADEVVFMYQGKIWESSSKEQFFSAPQTEEAKAFLNKIL